MRCSHGPNGRCASKPASAPPAEHAVASLATINWCGGAIASGAKPNRVLGPLAFGDDRPDARVEVKVLHGNRVGRRSGEEGRQVFGVLPINASARGDGAPAMPSVVLSGDNARGEREG